MATYLPFIQLLTNSCSKQWSFLSVVNSKKYVTKCKFSSFISSFDIYKTPFLSCDVQLGAPLIAKWDNLNSLLHSSTKKYVVPVSEQWKMLGLTFKIFSMSYLSLYSSFVPL